MLTPSRTLHQLLLHVRAVVAPRYQGDRVATLRSGVPSGKEITDRFVGMPLEVLFLASLLLGVALTPEVAEAQGLGPPTPHSTEGREACTQCHGAAGPLAMPASHQGRSDGTCLLCHAAVTSTPTPSPISTALPGAEPPVESTPMPTPAPSPSGTGFCLTCHGVPGLTMTFTNGDTVSLAVSADVFSQSVHGELLTCQACHPGHQRVPHPAVDVDSYRGYAIARYEVCKQCHFVNYTKTLDSVHFQVLSEGKLQAPVCTDCHGAHDVSSPHVPRTRIAHICSECHAEVYSAYLGSVHGQALTNEWNRDVPTCTDCHMVHNVRDLRAPGLHLEIPQMCGDCHADEERMTKYGLSTDVLITYLQDFHGMTVSLARRDDSDIRYYEAVCIDCHGIHEIVSTQTALSPVIKENLGETCRQCHVGATENFPSAWLSHYTPSLAHAPLVFLVKTFYRVFISTVVAGLVIQVLLNLWRAALRR